MYLIDFIYDGMKLSDYGCMVGYIVSSSDDSTSMGTAISLETIVNHGSYRSEIVNADYPDVYTCTFDIFRKPCGKFEDTFTDREASFFMRWLNRKEYCKFVPIYDDEHSFHETFFLGTFTEVSAITAGGDIQGFTLTFTANSPFCYTEIAPRNYKVNKDNNYFIIYDESDELGAVYPSKFIINSYQNGNISFKNDLDGRTTEIKNALEGEVITLDCIHKVITSNKEHVDTKLCNDFNYVFPRLVNTLKSNANVFTFSGNGSYDITIEYNPIRKAGVIV